jgi:hypothetical protein
MDGFALLVYLYYVANAGVFLFILLYLAKIPSAARRFEVPVLAPE